MALQNREAVALAKGRVVAPEPIGHHEKDRAIHVGQRLVVYNSVRSLIARGKIETYVEDGVKMMRFGATPW